MSTVPDAIPEREIYNPWRRSGTWMVVLMFVFAFSMIGLMFLYWELHTRPFRALQMAIGARHENSMPRVIGGKNKSHKPQSQARLRMIIAVDFDPTQGLPRPEKSATEDENKFSLTDEMQPDPRVEKYHGSLLFLAKENTDLSKYELIEIYLEYRRPEKATRTLFAERTKEDWFRRIPSDPWLGGQSVPESTPPQDLPTPNGNKPDDHQKP